MYLCSNILMKCFQYNTEKSVFIVCNHLPNTFYPLNKCLKDDYNYVRLVYLKNLDLFIQYLMLNLKKSMSFSNFFLHIKLHSYLSFFIHSFYVNMKYHCNKNDLMNTIIPIHEKNSSLN